MLSKNWSCCLIKIIRVGMYGISGSWVFNKNICWNLLINGGRIGCINVCLNWFVLIVKLGDVCIINCSNKIVMRVGRRGGRWSWCFWIWNFWRSGRLWLLIIINWFVRYNLSNGLKWWIWKNWKKYWCFRINF